MARKFARTGCRLILAARDAQELVCTRQDLTQRGAEFLAIPCNVTNQDGAKYMPATQGCDSLSRIGPKHDQRPGTVPLHMA